jgi:hypothetical protein
METEKYDAATLVCEQMGQMKALFRAIAGAAKTEQGSEHIKTLATLGHYLSTVLGGDYESDARIEWQSLPERYKANSPHRNY